MTVRDASFYDDLVTGAVCRGSTIWDADTVLDARRAIRGCGGCPVWSLCDDLRREVKPTAGVWAGLDCDEARRRQGRTVSFS